MKDQYVGDVNDYRKYGLLRILVGEGDLRGVVCWALTESDGRSDGSKTTYLNFPSDWMRYDPELFTFLRSIVVHQGNRSVKTVERGGVLPNFSFFGEPVPRGGEDRDIYFERCLQFAKGADILFLDPDNGLGVKSSPRGSRGSPKYVYESEVLLAYSRGHSILIYQHFPRCAREPFVSRLVASTCESTGAGHAISFSTSHVVFLLFPQRRHWSTLQAGAAKVAHRWRGQISVAFHLGEGRVERGAKQPALTDYVAGQMSAAG